MEEAPEDWRPWKSLLLEGAADPAVAAWLGALLAVLHSADGDIGSAGSFEAQRVDPYLRTIQRRHPELAERDRRLHRSAPRHDRVRRPRRLLAEERPRRRRRPLGDRLGGRPPRRSRLRPRLPAQPPAAEDDPPAVRHVRTTRRAGERSSTPMGAMWTCRTCSASSAASCSPASTASHRPSTSPSHEREQARRGRHRAAQRLLRASLEQAWAGLRL